MPFFSSDSNSHSVGTVLHETESLCPVCLRKIAARYIRKENAVFLTKTCPEHGNFSVPAWISAGDTEKEFQAWQRPKRPSYPARPITEERAGCPYDCGLCPSHAQHTCTGLIEVTARCNMSCPICYASAGEQQEDAEMPDAQRKKDPSLEDIQKQMNSLYAASGACNIQISGGEPTVREDLPEIIRMAQCFGLVQLNSNGLRLAKDEKYAQELKNAGLDSVYLQWDGITEHTFQTLRGRSCLDFKKTALKNCAQAGLGIVLVATLVRGVNDAELPDLLKLALSMGTAIRGLHIQPVASFGRFPWQLPEAPRLTLPEIMDILTSSGLVRREHFHAPSCEHSLCSFSALYRREENHLAYIGEASCCSSEKKTSEQTGSELKTDSKLKPAEQKIFAMTELAAQELKAAEQKTLKAEDLTTQKSLDKPEMIPAEEGARKAKAFIARQWRSPEQGKTSLNDAFGRFIADAGADKRFTLSCMAFQDAQSLDIERVRGCCIHVVNPEGHLIPFCLYNLTTINGTALYRKK